MKYVITGIDPNSADTWKNGGGRALIYLFNLFHYLGIECEINGAVEPDDIAIYPDIIQGNPCNAQKIVRYMLYFWSGERIPASECVTCYHPTYLQQVSEKYDGPTPDIVYLPTIEPGLFYPEEKTIEAVCYIGKQHGLVPPDLGCVQISKGTVSRQGFAAALRACRNFYSLDHHTIAYTEAALCGCECFQIEADSKITPVVIENPGQHVMNFERDAAVARRFHEIVTTFFR